MPVNNGGGQIDILRKQCNCLENKDIFLVGSAPRPDLTLYRDYMEVVTCNGSAANANLLSLKEPALTVVDFELLDPKASAVKPGRSIVLEKGLLRGIFLGHLVAVQSNSSGGGSPLALGARFTVFTELTRLDRTYIVQAMTGSDSLDGDVFGMVSTGAFALALSFYLGAKSVTLAGFSFFKEFGATAVPHFYDESSIDSPTLVDTRNHSLADAALITQLVLKRYHIRTEERDLLPLIQNWGRDPPFWAR